MTPVGTDSPVTTDPLVVVVAFHAADLLDRCLSGLEGAFDARVVDNSSDPAVAAVAARHGADYQATGRNLGFAGGVNLGCAGRDSRDVLLLNPDAIITPSAVRQLHARLDGDRALAAVAPTQHDPRDGTGARVEWPFPTPRGAWLEAAGLGRLRRGPNFLIGSVLLVADRALSDVGPFDDRYFLYAEETDWQRRAADLGWRTTLCPDVSSTHLGAGTGGDPTVRETHFQASHERYVRAHHGTLGWWSYRAAALCGFGTRTVVFTGERRRSAGLRYHLFRRGPLRAEAELGRTGLRIAHVVVTDNFAGVERYICQVADGLAARGHQVDVIGGAPARMRAELDRAVTHRPAKTVVQGTRALVAARGADVVHVHMTAAEASAYLARPVVRAPVVATRHFAAERGGTRRNRVLARVTTRHLAGDIAISQFVARAVEGPTDLIPNGVASRPQALLSVPVVVMLQRLDREKSPEVGIEAWARSGVAARGWQLVVAGSGVLLPDLERLVVDLGCGSSVTFAGQVADTDGLLAGSSILLAPAPAEPFGLSVVEAMAHGLAVVAAGGGAHLETVGDDGVLFPPGDADAAADALARLVADPVVLASVGHALRGRQQHRYSLDRHLDRLEALYVSVAGTGPVTPVR